MLVLIQDSKILYIDNKIDMTEDKNLVKIGQSDFIYYYPEKFIVEDKTKRGLPVIEISIDGSGWAFNREGTVL